MQTQTKLYDRKYRNKYRNVRDVYDKTSKKVNYSRFYKILTEFLKIVFRDVVLRKELVHLPNKMGYIYLEKKKHKRAFHYRIDLNESNKKGEKVIYKVPILDDFYYKIIWVRPKKYSRCKIMPLKYVKNLIKSI